jgi:DNA gyrase subunit B
LTKIDSNPVVQDNSVAETGILPPVELIEHIRLRPKIHFGRLGKHALHLLFNGAMEFTLADALDHRCTHIHWTLHADQSVTMEDDGPGLPVEDHVWGYSSLEIALSKIGAGYGNGGYTLLQSCYADLVMVNAASVMLHAEVRRNGYLWQQDYQHGRPQTSVIRVRKLEANEPTGTKLTFTPDVTILRANRFEFDRVAARLQELAYTVPGLTLTLRDEREPSAPREAVFHEPRGVEALVERINKGLKPLHPTLVIEREWKWDRKGSEPWADWIQIAFQFVEEGNSSIRGFINTCPANRGTHISGMRAALTEVINRWLQERDQQAHFSTDDILPGLSVVVNCLCPYFHWDLKSSRLISKQHYLLVYQTVHDAFTAYAAEHPEYMAAIVDKCRENQQMRSQHHERSV